jgi:DegV family protein with EDD domain
MSKVAIVTDSTSNLPIEVTRNLPIFTLPLQVIWGGETYRDGVDISSDQFYERLKTDKVLPTTSQPSPAAFRDQYVKLMEEGYDILTITITSKLSGTFDSAFQAKTMLPGSRIELVDSQTTSLALGLHVLRVAQMAAQGATLKEVKETAELARDHCGVFFVLNTLEYLHRGGRIGGAAAFVGTMLNLKPILEIRNGRVEAMERVRTSAKAIDRLLDLFEERVRKDKCQMSVATMYADTPREAEGLLGRAKARFGPGDVKEDFIGRVGPVLGVHTGPGALGIAYLTEM